MSQTFTLPFGAATVLDIESMSPPASIMRYGAREVEQYVNGALERRAKLRELIPQLAAGKAPRRPATPPYPRGVTLPSTPYSVSQRYNRRPSIRGGAAGARELAAYIENTGRRPRTITEALGALGVTDTARLERAYDEWTGRATPLTIDGTEV